MVYTLGVGTRASVRVGQYCQLIKNQTSLKSIALANPTLPIPMVIRYGRLLKLLNMAKVKKMVRPVSEQPLRMARRGAAEILDVM